MAGNLKMTMPSAFTTAMLAWGLASNRNGFAKTKGAIANAEQQVVWGADYLLKMLYAPSAGSLYVIHQVRAGPDMLYGAEDSYISEVIDILLPTALCCMSMGSQHARQGLLAALGPVCNTFGGRSGHPPSLPLSCILIEHGHDCSSRAV